MKNRIVSILTLGSFLVFSWSCYSIREIKPAVLESEKARDLEIRKVEKTSGEIIEYPKESPGRVRMGNITGKVKDAYGKYSSFTVLLTEVEKAWAKKFDWGLFMCILVPVGIVVVMIATARIDFGDWSGWNWGALK